MLLSLNQNSFISWVKSSFERWSLVTLSSFITSNILHSNVSQGPTESGGHLQGALHNRQGDPQLEDRVQQQSPRHHLQCRIRISLERKRIPAAVRVGKVLWVLLTWPSYESGGKIFTASQQHIPIMGNSWERKRCFCQRPYSKGKFKS